jgi:hypothetical protein
LHRHHDGRNSGNDRRCAPQPRDDRLLAAALGLVLHRNEHAALVEDTAEADGGGHIGDAGIAADDVDDAALQIGHGIDRNVRCGFRRAG